MRKHTLSAAVFSLLACTAHAQSKIPERTLGAPTVVGSESFRNIAAVRELSDGRVIVVERGPMNQMAQKLIADMAARMGRAGRGGRGGFAPDSTMPPQPKRVARVVMLDAALKTATPVGQSGTGATEYEQPDALVAGLHDTTLIVDLARSDAPVIDPSGRIVGSRPTPGPQIALIALGGLAVDHSGRLIYQPRTQSSRSTPAGMEIFTPDTAPLMAYDFKTGGTLPIGHVHVEPTSATMESDSTKPGSMHMRTKAFAFSTIDDWVMMPDGTIAIVRGSDLHIDWIGPNGRMRSTPAIPYAKIAVADSDKAKFRARLAGTSALMDSMPMMPRNMSMTQSEPDSFPAFKPPFSTRGAKAASDGSIWIPARIISPDAKEGYDVIGPNGRVRERIYLAKGQRLLGFGKDVVYVAVNEGPQDNRVARVALH